MERVSRILLLHPFLAILEIGVLLIVKSQCSKHALVQELILLHECSLRISSQSLVLDLKLAEIRKSEEEFFQPDIFVSLSSFNF
jgi:hypothetical protein